MGIGSWLADSLIATQNVASDGGLVSLGTDHLALGRRAAFYVDKILKGAKPSDLPVERPTIYKLSVNLKAAKAAQADYSAIAAGARG